MTNPEKYHYYTLPLEKGTVRLTLDTLNKHSDFRFPERPYLVIRKRTISFQNEVLILGIRLGEEKEERVYIRVLQEELRVSCSVDTDYTYLSRYAYFALYSFTWSGGGYNFGKYYWPDFFDPKTGKSKYLTVIIDRAGTDIKRKPKYAFFYKPGDKLLYPFRRKKAITTATPTLEKDNVNQFNLYAIGYCLADTQLSSARSAHFPLIVRYRGIWEKNHREIKGFNQFVITPNQAIANYYTPIQEKINVLCRKMQTLAPIKIPEYRSTDKEKQAVKRENLRTLKLVYALWQKAVPLLQTQPFTHYFFTHGLRNVKGKPRKQDMKACTFSSESPQLCFLLVGKGDYYELELRFKAEGKFYVPNECNPTFFIHSTAAPNRFYLMDSITDYHVLCFFERHNFKLSVLKCHYQGHFKTFIDRLAEAYELTTKGIDSHEKEEDQ